MTKDTCQHSKTKSRNHQCGLTPENGQIWGQVYGNVRGTSTGMYRTYVYCTGTVRHHVTYGMMCRQDGNGQAMRRHHDRMNPSSRVLNRGAASVWLQTDGGKTEKKDDPYRRVKRSRKQKDSH
jgi:hypothetical protein